MENGGFTNTEFLHMNEDDTTRDKRNCSFYFQSYDYFDHKETCRLLHRNCITSSHCPHYTTDAHKAILEFDKINGVSGSQFCEYIDLEKGNLPLCRKELPVLGLICFGKGHKQCPLKKELKKERNDLNIVNYFDSVKLQRQENNNFYSLIIENIPLIPKDELISKLINKKLHDHIEYDGYDWTIVRIKKTEKQQAFVVHKKKNTDTNKKNKNKAISNPKAIRCDYCHKMIQSKDYANHLQKEKNRQLIKLRKNQEYEKVYSRIFGKK